MCIYIYTYIYVVKTTFSCRFFLKHLQWCLEHPTYAYQVAAHSKPAEVLSSIIVGTTMVKPHMTPTTIGFMVDMVDIYLYLLYGLMWLKPWHKTHMTGNGKHTTN
jgi:hypothetical protein